MNIEWTRQVWTLTFLLSWTLVNIEWTRQILENMDPHLLVELDVGEY